MNNRIERVVGQASSQDSEIENQSEEDESSNEPEAEKIREISASELLDILDPYINYDSEGDIMDEFFVAIGNYFNDPNNKDDTPNKELVKYFWDLHEKSDIPNNVAQQIDDQLKERKGKRETSPQPKAKKSRPWKKKGKTEDLNDDSQQKDGGKKNKPRRPRGDKY